jgi:TonB-dependent starch-binding outer membrane protein SusC
MKNFMSKRPPEFTIRWRKMLRILELTFIFFISALVTYANGAWPEGIQAKVENAVQKAVSGTVTDGSGQPLPGVTVLVKGTTHGTVTNATGNYFLSDISDEATLVFSFVGMVTKELQVGNNSTIDVTLEEESIGIEEVIAIGYGSVRKSDLTGSVSKVSSEEVRKSTAVSLETALQGKAAGVMVTQASSAPGGGISVRIRGGNSIQGGNEPLYVIDGIPVYSNNNEVSPGGGQFNELRTAPNALASLNPSDIESMEVLKDASATAIYGSRGANGVVLITTRRGKAGQARVEFDTYQGVQHITKRFDVLNASDLMRWANEGSVNGGQTAPFSDETIANPQYDTDWQNEILVEGAPVSNYQLSVSGGNEKIIYSISGNYYTQDGIIKNSGFDRYSMRLNLESQVNNWMKVGNNLSFARTINDQAFEGGSGNANSSALFSALAYVPMLPVYNETTGNYSRREDAIVPGYSPYNRLNPVHLVNEMTDKTISDRTLGNFFVDFKLMKDLSFRSIIGFDFDTRERDYYFSNNKDPFNRKGSASIGYTKALSLLNTNMLTYEKVMNKHRVTATGVYELQQRTTQRSGMSNSIFDNDITMYYDIAAGTQNGGPGVYSNYIEWTMASYLGRLNYSFNDKYLLTVSARADGSSKFGKDNKWGFFPSAAVAWKMSEENFIQSLNLFSSLKLRASAGRTGNQEIGVNQAVTRYSRGKYTFGGQEVNIYLPTVGNSNLKWETTNQVDIGTDMGFFRERVSLSFDAYYKKTFDLLMTYNIPSELGYGSTTGNVGKLENKGIELTLGAWIVDSKIFKWRTDFNFAANENKVLDLGSSTIIRGARFSYDYGDAFNSGNLVKVGYPVGSFFGLITDGIYSTQQEIDNNTLQYSGNVVPDIGSARYKDISGKLDADGNYTAPDGLVDQNDRAVLGSPHPKFIYGWNNTITLGFIEISAFFQGVYGNKILNLNRRDLYDEMYQHNISQDRFDNAWRVGNENAIYPKANARIGIVQRIPAGVYSDFFLEDGSYLRLKNLRLTLTVPGQALKNKGVVAKVYLAGSNLLTLTNYQGYNPEVNQQGQSNVNQGVDMGSYPLAKSYMLGVNLSF